MDNETILQITINTKKPLTEEEIWYVMNDFKARIEGYHTEGVECLDSADIGIKYVETRKPLN